MGLGRAIQALLRTAVGSTLVSVTSKVVEVLNKLGHPDPLQAAEGLAGTFHAFRQKLLTASPQERVGYNALGRIDEDGRYYFERVGRRTLISAMSPAKGEEQTTSEEEGVVRVAARARNTKVPLAPVEGAAQMAGMLTARLHVLRVQHVIEKLDDQPASLERRAEVPAIGLALARLSDVDNPDVQALVLEFLGELYLTQDARHDAFAHWKRNPSDLLHCPIARGFTVAAAYVKTVFALYARDEREKPANREVGRRAPRTERQPRKPASGDATGQTWSRSAAAKALGVDEGQLRRWEKLGHLHPVRVDGSVRYDGNIMAAARKVRDQRKRRSGRT